MPLTASSNPEINPLLKSSGKLGTNWPHIERAHQAAAEQRILLTEHLKHISLSADTGLLVFGSLARSEWTAGSDVDWTLLVDGQADPNHLRVAQSITDSLESMGIKRPGRTGVFGGMAFSHQIVHYIGGEPDTNQNTTRRILLLLESDSIGQTPAGQPDDVRDRVIRAVIDRYLEDDQPSIDGHRVPRFLLNDIVRFWRTMAVDYASKRRERGDQGWAIRNVKLRFSRKLVFVAGLLTCFSPALAAAESGSSDASGSDATMVQYLRSVTEHPPLQILASAARKYCDADTAMQMFGAYDGFLAILDDAGKRSHFDALVPTDAPTDPLFLEMRKTSRQFQESLNTLFFKSNDTLSQLSMEYGLF